MPSLIFFDFRVEPPCFVLCDSFSKPEGPEDNACAVDLTAEILVTLVTVLPVYVSRY